MNTNRSARELAAELSRHAEAVCRTYLSNGKRQGHHWVRRRCRQQPWSEPLRVRLTPGRKAAGRWADAATGQHGDLLDLIQAACGFTDLRRHGRGAPLPGLPQTGRRSVETGSPRRHATGRTCAAAVPGRPANRRHPGGRISSPPRSDRRQLDGPALSPVLLLQGLGRRSHRDVAGAAGRHQRCPGHDRGRSPHLARPLGPWERRPSRSRASPWATRSATARASAGWPSVSWWRARGLRTLRARGPAARAGGRWPLGPSPRRS